VLVSTSARARPAGPLLAAAIALAAAGCDRPTAPAPTTTPAPPTPTPDPVAERYVRYCAACHGADGQTVAGMPAVPLLRGQGLLTVADDAFLRASIADGRPGENGRGQRGTKMSAFHASRRGPFDDAQVDELVAFIRAWQTEPSIELDGAWRADGDPESGRARYEADCASCHGPEGWGELAPRLAGETLQAAASDDFLRQTILRGRPGTAMVAFDYDEATVADVVAFVRTLGPDGAAGAAPEAAP